MKNICIFFPISASLYLVAKLICMYLRLSVSFLQLLFLLLRLTYNLSSPFLHFLYLYLPFPLFPSFSSLCLPQPLPFHFKLFYPFTNPFLLSIHLPDCSYDFHKQTRKAYIEQLVYCFALKRTMVVLGLDKIPDNKINSKNFFKQTDKSIMIYIVGTIARS